LGTGTIWALAIFGAVLVAVIVILMRGRIVAALRSEGGEDFGAERRKFVRFRAEFPIYFQAMAQRPERRGVSASVDTGGKWRPCLLNDISLGGICARLTVEDDATWKRMLSGELEPAFRFRLEKMDREINATAAAVWGKIEEKGPPPAVVAGFAFTEISEEDRASIGIYIKERYHADYGA
jgi:hypothetical protein